MSAGLYGPVQYESRDACSTPRGNTSQCGKVATHLALTEAELTRIARLANRSAKNYERYRDELNRARAERSDALNMRDAHMAECDAAAERFGVLS